MSVQTHYCEVDEGGFFKMSSTGREQSSKGRVIFTKELRIEVNKDSH
jgi:hypothetical protein